MNIDTVKAQENLDEPEKAFELDNVAVRLVRSRDHLCQMNHSAIQTAL